MIGIQIPTVFRSWPFFISFLNKGVNSKTFDFWMGWTIGSKPVGQNDIFTLRPKYYDKAENRRANMTIRPKKFIVIFTVYYMT